MNGEDVVFEVLVRHNAVQAIRRVPRAPGMHVPDSNLEVTSELARNHQRHGCIDGRYRFDEPERARSFAVLALDFVKRMLERRIEQIEALDTGADFAAPEYGATRRQQARHDRQPAPLAGAKRRLNPSDPRLGDLAEPPEC